MNLISIDLISVDLKLNIARSRRLVPDWRVDIRLPGKGDSNSHGARPAHRIITMIQWIRTSRLSIENYHSEVGSKVGRGRLQES